MLNYQRVTPGGGQGKGGAQDPVRRPRMQRVRARSASWGGLETQDLKSP